MGLLSRRFGVTVVSGTARPEPAALRRVRYLRWDALGSRFKPIEWLRLLAGARHIRRLLERADIVYIPSHTLLPLAAAAKRLRPGVKVVVHLHNFQPLAYTSVLLADGGPGAAQDFLVERMEHGSLPRAAAAGLGHYANRAVSLLALSCADAVVCVSRRRRDILLRYIPELRGKTAVIYNPPPPLPSAGKELGGEPVLVYAGGSSYVKGFHVLLELLRKTARGGARRPCRFYVVAGRGSEGPLKALSAALGGPARRAHGERRQVGGDPAGGREPRRHAELGRRRGPLGAAEAPHLALDPPLAPFGGGADGAGIRVLRGGDVRRKPLPLPRQRRVLLETAGFRVVGAYHPIINNLAFIDAEPEDRPRISGRFDLVGLFAKRPSRLNALRLLAYPLVRLRPSLRQLIVVVGVKAGEPKPEAVER